MKSKSKKDLKQEKASNTEDNFELFCQKNYDDFSKLDNINNLKEKTKFLTNPSGKCPDFWCKEKGKEIFVEVKTLTNLTNKAREDQMDRAAKRIQKAGLGGGILSPVFDPTPELEGPFTKFIKDSSSKFKNIKNEITAPRVIFLDAGLFGNSRFTTHALLLGAYDSYAMEDNELVYAGLKKEKRGLFDKTGSNVSALIYWNSDDNCFSGVGNPNAKISLSEEDFAIFFGKEKIYQFNA